MIKIALISDIHFGKFSRTSDFSVPGEPTTCDEFGSVSLKEGLIKKIAEEQAKYLVVTGDLTSIGSPNEFFLCHEAIKEIAIGSGIDLQNIIITLGNHDIDWNISRLSDDYDNSNPDCRKRVLESYLSIAGSVANQWIQYEYELDQSGPAPFSGVKEYDEVIFFSLNSGWLCNHQDSHRQGKLSKDQLIWLERQLELKYDSEKWKILLLHHHPFNYPYQVPCADHSVLMEGPELIDVIGKNGVNIVCHGHRHHPRVKSVKENTWKNAITYISSGSLSVNIEHRQEDIPNLFHILELAEEKSFYLRSYKYSTIEGWIGLKENTSSTPLDYEMFFKEPYLEAEIQRAIEKLCNFNESTKIIEHWKLLSPELKSIKFDDLNKRISEYCSLHNIQIFGKIPERMALMKQQ